MSTSEDKGLIIFGKDVTKIPCFRNSFLYGISGGLGCGLVRFMFTSRPKSGADFAVGSFAVITLAYWFRCQYQYSKVKFEMQRTQKLLQQHIIDEGTDRENKDVVESSLVEA